MLEQVTIMLNRCSEDYVRETETRRPQLFGVFSKLLDEIEGMAGHLTFDSASFLGTWVEMFLCEADPGRCCKVLNFCRFAVEMAAANQNSAGFISKYVVKPVQKFIKLSQPELVECQEMAAYVLAKFSILVDKMEIESDKKEKYLNDILTLLTPPNCNYSLSACFLYRLFSEDTCPEYFYSFPGTIANVTFNFLCNSHVSNENIVKDELEKHSVLLKHLLKCPQLIELEQKFSTISPLKGGLVIDLTLDICHLYQTKQFSDAQVLKNFAWRMFDGISGTFNTILVKEKHEDLVCKRVYNLLSHFIENLSDLLYSPSRPNSPLLSLFQTFFVKRDQTCRKYMLLSLTTVFSGLSKLSYRSNNLFFKDISKVFDDAYTSMAAKDWELKKPDPRMVSLFALSFQISPEESVGAFRGSIMEHVAAKYCVLPQSPDKLVVLLYFLSKLEERTRSSVLLLRDCTLLLPFLLQVNIQ